MISQERFNALIINWAATSVDLNRLHSSEAHSIQPFPSDWTVVTSKVCSRDMYLESEVFLSVSEEVMRYACGEEKGDDLEEQLTFTEIKARCSSSIRLSIEIHVVFDHTYNVCCPLIRVSGITDQSGTYITAAQFQSIINVMQKESDLVIDEDDGMSDDISSVNTLRSFSLSDEYHPILNKPFIQPHICSIKDRLLKLDEGGDAKCELHILRVLNLVGPALGFTMSPTEFAFLQQSFLTC